MDYPRVIRILLIEDNKEFSNLVQLFLQRYREGLFQVTWKDNGRNALAELEKDQAFDVILMDYFLPGMNGLEVTRELQNRQNQIPVIFLTVNKDFDLAVEVMKLGVEDYLVKEEISTPVLPKTILSVIERRALREQLTQLEISERRLETIHELVHGITGEIRVPLDQMRVGVDKLFAHHQNDGVHTYLLIMRDNLKRIEKRIQQLKELKSDKTVPYVHDIRMFDLSDNK
jgi:CheY-like chemotaxis protein